MCSRTQYKHNVHAAAQCVEVSWTSAFLLPRALTDVLFLLFVPSALRGVQHVTICTFQFCKKAGTCPLVLGPKNWDGLGSAGGGLPSTTSLFGTQGVRAPGQSKASNTGGMVSCKCAKPHEHLSKRFASQWFPVNSILISLRNALRPSSLVSFQLCKSMTRKCLLQGDSASADDNTYVGVMGGFPTLGKAILCESWRYKLFHGRDNVAPSGLFADAQALQHLVPKSKDWHGRL